MNNFITRWLTGLFMFHRQAGRTICVENPLLTRWNEIDQHTPPLATLASRTGCWLQAKLFMYNIVFVKFV